MLATQERESSLTDLFARKYQLLEAQKKRHDDIIAVVLFCAIGFLITLNLLLRYPDFGELIERCKLF
jgi:activator of 2-hydroxyglutaryl-CoA dehydratase